MPLAYIHPAYRPIVLAVRKWTPSAKTADARAKEILQALADAGMLVRETESHIGKQMFEPGAMHGVVVDHPANVPHLSGDEEF